MSARQASEPPASAPTSGAWTGVLVAAWAASTTTWHVAWFAAVHAAPAIFGRLAAQAEEGPAGEPAAVARIVELVFELSRTLQPHARIADAGAVVLGFALFCAAYALVRGSESGRRAARALLALKALASLGSAAWLVVLFVTTLRDWSGRFAAVVAELALDAPHGPRAASVNAQVSAWIDAAPVAFFGVVVAGTTVTLALAWLVGRPSARAWCAARSGDRTVDSPAPSR
jgi:hypothetical protein